MPQTSQFPLLSPRPEYSCSLPLGEVAERLGIPGGNHPGLVSGIAHTHLAIRPGDLFVVLPDSRADAGAAVAAAAAAGAVAVLAEPDAAARLGGCGLPVLVLPAVRARLAELCTWLYGRAAERLLCVGVTGTNGKTTTSYLLEGGLKGPAGFPGCWARWSAGSQMSGSPAS